MTTQAAARRTARPRFLAIPAVRRLPCALAFAASIAVFATSLRALPAGLLAGLAAVWLAGIAAGALAPRRGPLVLTVIAALTKTATVALVVWPISHPHSPVGPHGPLDWIPLGMLNAATGLWLLAVIRHRAR
jgi:hypothetical protein